MNIVNLYNPYKVELPYILIHNIEDDTFTVGMFDRREMGVTSVQVSFDIKEFQTPIPVQCMNLSPYNMKHVTYRGKAPKKPKNWDEYIQYKIVRETRLKNRYNEEYNLSSLM